MRTIKQPVYSSRSADKFVLRLPDGMRTQVEALAREAHCSMNSYMIGKLTTAVAIDTGEHTPYTPVIGMVLEHKASGSVGTLEGISVYEDGLKAQINWVTMLKGTPTFREPILLTDLRPYVV